MRPYLLPSLYIKFLKSVIVISLNRIGTGLSLRKSIKALIKLKSNYLLEEDFLIVYMIEAKTKISRIGRNQ